MAKKTKKKEVKEIKKTNHHKKEIVIILLLMTILVVAFFAVKVYVKNEKKESFAQGAQSAIHDIVTQVETKGGVGIKQGDEIMILAEYTKKANNTIENQQETNETSITNETVETVNETA